jgi:hypothetical protein
VVRCELGLSGLAWGTVAGSNVYCIELKQELNLYATGRSRSKTVGLMLVLRDTVFS